MFVSWKLSRLEKQLLYSDSVAVRSSAADALGDLGDPRAVESLIRALDDNGYEVHRRAADALGKIRDARSVSPLIRLLNRGLNEPYPRRDYLALPALHALGEIGSVRALDALYSVAIWWTPPSATVGAAASNLARLGPTLSVDALLQGGFEAYEKLEAAKREMRRVVESGTDHLGSAAVNALEKMTEGKILPEAGVDVPTRIITNDISDWPSDDLIPPDATAARQDTSVTGLQHDDPNVRLCTAARLARTQDARVVDALGKLLRAPGPEESRVLAAKCLGVIGNVTAIPDLARCMKNSESYKVRVEAALSLGSTGDASTISALTSLFNDSTAEALMREADRTDMLIGLVVGWDGSTEWNKRALKLRRAALAALGAIFDSRAHRFVMDALGDPEDGVRGTATAASLIQKICFAQAKVSQPVLREAGGLPALHGLFSLAELTQLAQGKKCLICGKEMKTSKPQFSLTCSDGHDELHYFAFDNSYGTLSKQAAVMLAGAGCKVQKAKGKEQWHILCP